MSERESLLAEGIRAELLPLSGKYYGSQIRLTDPSDGRELETMTIWVMGDYAPSERELADHDEDNFGPYEVYDSHFESALGYRICNLIVTAINGK